MKIDHVTGFDRKSIYEYFLTSMSLKITKTRWVPFQSQSVSQNPMGYENSASAISNFITLSRKPQLENRTLFTRHQIAIISENLVYKSGIYRNG